MDTECMPIGRTAWVLAGAFACAGCTATYAPPLRSTHGGAPGRVSEGDVAISGGASGWRYPTVAGGPAISYGVRDWVAVEGGGNVSLGRWGMGWAGLRLTHAPRRYAKNYLAIDGEASGGAGWGGSLCGNGEADGCADGLRAGQRVAGGGLLGGGVAGHFSFFSVYARARGQLTAATAVPMTMWGSWGGGMQFRIARTVDLYAQAGMFGYRNERDHFRGMLTEAGVAIRIPTWRWRR